MTTRLVQKDLFGAQEFELVDQAVHVRSRTLFQKKELSVVLSILDPEPVIEPPYLHFHSRVKCDPLLSLVLNKPNPKAFNAFVEELQQRLRAYSVFLGPGPAAAHGLERPPTASGIEPERKPRQSKNVDVDRIDSAIRMLGQYLESEDIGPVVAALEALRSQPNDAAHLARLAAAFDGLGPRQGAVLTYAPYIGILLSDHPFGGS